MTHQPNLPNPFSMEVSLHEKEFSPQEKKVAGYLLSHGDDLDQESVDSITRSAGVSAASVVRFCKTMGYSGLKALKIAFASPIKAHGRQTIAWEDDGRTVFAKTFLGTMDVMKETSKKSSWQDYEEAAKLLLKADPITVVGIGGSEIVAHFASTQLERLGKAIIGYTDKFALERLSHGLSRPAKAVIAVSASGETREVVDYVRLARKSGSAVVTLTAAPGSSLAKESDAVLGSPSYPVFADDTHSYTRIAQITQVTCLYLELALLMGVSIPDFKERYIGQSNYRTLAEKEK